MRDGPWAGPVSWRKPIEFGLSAGLTLGSCALVLRLLPRSWLAWPVAIGLCFFIPETALIDLQMWRGVPSHFNNATPFDSAVFSFMGIAILFVIAGVFLLTGWTLVSVRASPSLALAVRAGMVSLALGQVAGYVLLANGNSAGHTPDNASLIGAAGELKIPHAVALHGLQVLGMLALVLRRTDLSERRRVALVWCGIGGYTGLLVVVSLQTAGGTAPLQVSTATVAAVIAAAVVAGAYAVALLGRRRVIRA